MAKLRIEIQITFLTLIIAAAVVGSGYLVYKSLSEIVGSVHQAALPDNRLFVMKDIEAGLARVENNVRLHILSGEKQGSNKHYLAIRNSVRSDLRKLNSLNPLGIEDRPLADSVITIAHRKLENWNDVLELYESTRSTKPAFNEIYSKLEKQKVDTIETERPKRGFFRSIFGTTKTETDTQLVVRDMATDEIREELKRLEAEWQQQGQQFNVLESKYIEQDLVLTEILNSLVSQFEGNVSEKLIKKTEEADRLAAETYKRLAYFTIVAVVLLLLVLFLLFNYLRKSRKYERMLKTAKAEAEAFARAREQFAANVSHEIRTPIHSIFGLSEQLLRKDMSPGVKEQVLVLSKSARHLKNIVDDTLDFSKIQANRLKLETLHFSLSEVINEILSIERSEAVAKGLELRHEIKGGLAKAVVGDPVRLKQIFLNLVSNSIKFTDSGYVLLQAETKIRDEKKCTLKITIEDTGIGISKEAQEIIFDEFIQAENTATKKYRGTGLGLSIVKKLVHLHGGKITLESEEGKGTKIFVEIPYTIGDPEKIEGAAPQMIQVPDSFKKLSFLIVDDEEYNRFLFRSIFGKWGVKYTEASNGDDAIAACRSEKFDIVFMDLNMPGRNGLEATKEILAEKPDLKIVAITASNEKADSDASIKAGMVGFLSKPFSESDLYETIIEKLRLTNEKKPDIDFKTLKRLANNDKAFLKEMLEIFIRSAERGLASIENEFTAKNLEAVADAAHKMKAPCRHIKANMLHDLLLKLEISAKNRGQEKDLARLIDEIKTEVSETVSSVQTYLQGSRANPGKN